MREVAAFCRKWDMLPQGGGVLCAVSGGRDSMALLHLLQTMAEEEGFLLTAAHFNHQLRPTAQRDEDFVRSWCDSHGVPLVCGRGDVAAYAREAGKSLEDAARTLRYRFLEETADQVGADRIATAHHRRDNAETVLLHLLRGAGLQGLTGIPPVRGRIVRPLLETDREEIQRYVDENHIPFVEDETNQETIYTRNRLRLEVLPLLEEIAPGCTGRLAGTAALLREENGHLDRETAALLPPTGENTLPAAVLLRQDQAIRQRLVRAMAQRLGVELTARQTQGVLELGSGGHLDLPDGLTVCRGKTGLDFQKKQPPPPPLELHPGQQRWGAYTVRVAEGTEEPRKGVALSAGKLDGPLTIAQWDGTGRLAVENGSRTIKRLFADRGILVDRRGEHPALLLSGRTVAVFGVAVDWELCPREGEKICVVTLEKEDENDLLL